jgi:hypothetical protein
MCENSHMATNLLATNLLATDLSIDRNLHDSGER